MKTYILITGATGGLGSAFAMDCARRGYDLYLTDLRPEVLDFARCLATTYQVEARAQACDLASPEARSHLYESLKAEGVRFWGLINVAGMDYEGAFLERTREQVLHILRLNVEATLDTTYAILNLRDPEQRFRLINVCSMAAYFPMPYKAVYAATKRFLLDFSLALAEEIQPFGTVTALCPAGLPTTPEVMQAIFAQGFWGLATTVDPRKVARKTIDKALKGRRVYIPGWLNRFLHGLGALAPVGLAVHLVGNRWRNAQTETMASYQLMPWRISGRMKAEG